MVQQPIQDRGGDDRIAEDGPPFAITLVGSQNDAASLVTGADQLEEDRGAIHTGPRSENDLDLKANEPIACTAAVSWERQRTAHGAVAKVFCLHRQLQLDGIVRCVHEILLSAEIAFGCLNR
jgi:hypothetical protein